MITERITDRICGHQRRDEHEETRKEERAKVERTLDLIERWFGHGPVTPFEAEAALYMMMR